MSLPRPERCRDCGRPCTSDGLHEKPSTTARSTQKWAALNAAIRIKLDQAETAWQNAKEELAALKEPLPNEYVPGIGSQYAYLIRSFDIFQARHAIIMRFGNPALRTPISLSELLVANIRDARGRETRIGQLYGAVEAAQSLVDRGITPLAVTKTKSSASSRI